MLSFHRSHCYFDRTRGCGRWSIAVVGAEAVVEEVTAKIVRGVAIAVGIAVVAVVGRLKVEGKKGGVAVVTCVAGTLWVRRRGLEWCEFVRWWWQWQDGTWETWCGRLSNKGSADLRRERDGSRLLAELETAGMDVFRGRRSKGRRNS